MNPDTSSLKAAQLFAFIRELARLGQKPIESLDSYIKTFWLDQIPHEPECDFVAWNRPGGIDEETEVDHWLAVERPERPDPPAVAEDLLPWVDLQQWQTSAIEYPELLPRILNASWKADNPEVEPQFLELKDFPQIQETWDKYIESEWWPWAEEDNRKARVQECYDELFGMHRTQVVMDEQYEFLLAVGCLHWTSPSGARTKRHLLILPVTIEFDSVNAVVTVRSVGSTPEIRLETDMLGIRDRPPADIEEDAEARCSLLGEDLFDQDVKTLLKAYVQGMDSEGMFVDTLERVTGEPPQRPRVHFAPALVIRRRTSRSLIVACDKIIEQLQNEPSGEAPPTVRKIAGELGVDRAKSEEGSETRNGRRSRAFELL